MMVLWLKNERSYKQYDHCGHGGVFRLLGSGIIELISSSLASFSAKNERDVVSPTTRSTRTNLTKYNNFKGTHCVTVSYSAQSLKGYRERRVNIRRRTSN